MNFGVLSLIVLAGLAGPLLASGRRAFVPVVIGEIVGGLIIGRSGFGAIDPTNPTLSFLSDVGFAMLMLSVGMDVPLRDPRLAGALRRGALAAAVAIAVAPLGGFLAGWASGVHHVAIYAVVLASASAAVVLPALEEQRLATPETTVLIAQITIADVVTIVAVPLVLQPSRAGRAALGGLLVVAGAIALYVIARRLPRGFVHRARKLSRQRRWALDLRVSLLALFGLSWVAQQTGTSILIAGFSAGLVVAALGGPKRLSRQVLGVAAGLFVPLFFVVLGARLDIGALFARPSLLGLTAVLLALNVAGHLVAAAATRQPAASALAASAQLGVPAAVVALGLQKHVLSAAVGSAIIVAALGSLGVSALGVTLLARRAPGVRPKRARRAKAAASRSS